MEILNSAQVTPQRLYALLRLVETLRHPTREELLDLLQPPALTSNQSAATAVFLAAQQIDLVVVHDDGIVTLHKSLESIQPQLSVENFRLCLQEKLCGIEDETADNYLLNLFTAWYAVQNERVFSVTNKDITVQFNRELFPFDQTSTSDDYSGRAFNPTKYNGWRTWATFLGWGLSASIANADVVPDARGRLQPLTSRLLPEQDFVPMRTYIGRLGELCPELDGGRLFRQCWSVSRSSEQRGNKLSLMLSTGLRVLHELEVIELQRLADATDRWLLFEADGALINEVTHIRARN